MQNIRIASRLILLKPDTTPPTKPRVTTPLGGKATTLTTEEVTTDPNTSVHY